MNNIFILNSWYGHFCRNYSSLILAGQCPGCLAIENRFREAAHWVLVAKSGFTDPKKCTQIKKWRNIGRKTTFWMFDIAIWIR